MSGFRGRYKNKREAVEGEVIASLEAHGIGVVPMDKPVDLLCLYAGVTHLVEVKAPKGRLTDAQEQFLERWPGYVTILRSAEEADAWAQEIRGAGFKNEA